MISANLTLLASILLRPGMWYIWGTLAIAGPLFIGDVGPVSISHPGGSDKHANQRVCLHCIAVPSLRCFDASMHHLCNRITRRMAGHLTTCYCMPESHLASPIARQIDTALCFMIQVNMPKQRTT
jgi:hypothetical protein